MMQSFLNLNTTPPDAHKQIQASEQQARSSKCGPSHSMDSLARHQQRDSDLNKSNLTASTKSSTEASPKSQEEEQRSPLSTTSHWTTKLFGCQEDTTVANIEDKSVQESVYDAFDDVCTCPEQAPALGIARLSMDLPLTMDPPLTAPSSSSPHSDSLDAFSTTSSMDTPAGRRRLKHQRRMERLASLEEGEQCEQVPCHQPIANLILEDTYELSKSISELTMKSSQPTPRIGDNRRMAYYAVGKHHRQTGRGGNRRCYFTGKLVLGGSPFYAGSVQQGLRTLVVFCLPSSLGLPSDKNSKPSDKKTNLSMDEMSLSVDEELDPNWDFDSEYLLSVLPNPSPSLLDEMKVRFPSQYNTLPVQVQNPSCWQLYIKFCFFSGLPIADGELHYRVTQTIAQGYGEEICLSHEVMEAVNGESSQLLRLPNLKAFAYLKKHYQQQSQKLPKSCFFRNSWELMLPEI